MSSSTCACGIYNCDMCEYLASAQCPGCRAGNAQLDQDKREACAVFACAESSGLKSCSDCQTASCKLIRSVESLCPLRSLFEKKRWWAGKMSRAFESRRQIKADAAAEELISEKVVTRLRRYLGALELFALEGNESVSSWQIAERIGVNSALVRKDLSRFGEFGTPSFGYRVDYLRTKIRSILKLDKPRELIWIGACMYRNVHWQLERLETFDQHVVALFDVDEKEIGQEIRGLTVSPIDQLADAVADNGVATIVIAIPCANAQFVANAAINAGVKGILNLSGDLLVVPDNVRVMSMDVVGELMELSYYCC